MISYDLKVKKKILLSFLFAVVLTIPIKKTIYLWYYLVFDMYFCKIFEERVLLHII